MSSLITTVDTLNGSSFGRAPSFSFGAASMPMGLPMANPSPFGSGTGSREDGNQYLDQGRLQVTYTLCVTLGKSASARAQALSALGLGCILFVVNDRDNAFVTASSDQFVQVKSLAAVNLMFKTEAAANLADGQAMELNNLQPSDLIRRFSFYGLQRTDTSIGSYRNRSNTAITLTVAHRQKVPDIWLQGGLIVNMGSRLYLEWQRVRYQAANNDFINNPNPANVLHWQLVPVVRPDTDAPKDPTPESGLIFIGTAHDRYGYVSSSDKFRLTARRATSNMNLMDSAKAMQALPFVDVHVRM
jgi:hypothetical protein